MENRNLGAGDRPSARRILRRAEVLDRINLSSTSLWRLRTRGDFPTPFWISPGLLAWLEADVDAWIDDRRRRGLRGAGLSSGGVVAPKGRQTAPARSTQATSDAGKRGEGFQP